MNLKLLIWDLKNSKEYNSDSDWELLTDLKPNSLEISDDQNQKPIGLNLLNDEKLDIEKLYNQAEIKIESQQSILKFLLSLKDSSNKSIFLKDDQQSILENLLGKQKLPLSIDEKDLKNQLKLIQKLSLNDEVIVKENQIDLELQIEGEISFINDRLKFLFYNQNDGEEKMIQEVKNLIRILANRSFKLRQKPNSFVGQKHSKEKVESSYKNEMQLCLNLLKVRRNDLIDFLIINLNFVTLFKNTTGNEIKNYFETKIKILTESLINFQEKIIECLKMIYTLDEFLKETIDPETYGKGYDYQEIENLKKVKKLEKELLKLKYQILMKKIDETNFNFEKVLAKFIYRIKSRKGYPFRSDENWDKLIKSENLNDQAFDEIKDMLINFESKIKEEIISISESLTLSINQLKMTNKIEEMTKEIHDLIYYVTDFSSKLVNKYVPIIESIEDYLEEGSLDLYNARNNRIEIFYYLIVNLYSVISTDSTDNEFRNTLFKKCKNLMKNLLSEQEKILKCQNEFSDRDTEVDEDDAKLCFEAEIKNDFFLIQDGFKKIFEVDENRAYKITVLIEYFTEISPKLIDEAKSVPVKENCSKKRLFLSNLFLQKIDRNNLIKNLITNLSLLVSHHLLKPDENDDLIEGCKNLMRKLLITQKHIIELQKK